MLEHIYSGVTSFFSPPFDVVAIGDITTDAFIRLKEARVHCNINDANCEICMGFGDKIPFEQAYVLHAVGNSPNAAVCASRLGLRTALVTRIGNDQNGKDCYNELVKNKVATDYVVTEKGKETNFHYVLWFESDRTILIKHNSFTNKMPRLGYGAAAPKWIYLSSVGGGSEVYHTEIMEYLHKNPKVKLAFQPGTFQMKLGTERLKYLYERTEVFTVNVEEAQRILNSTEYNKKNLLKMIARLGPKIVCITDGPKGAYMLDTRENNGAGESYFMPIYPDPKAPLERTGCGDSFTSTFMTALIYGKTPLEALVWAPVNPMSVVQYVGAQKGLLSRKELQALLDNKPSNYFPEKI